MRILFAALLLVGCTREPTPAPPVAPPVASAHASAAPVSLPARTKETGCVARGPLPDPACTPGAVMADVDAARACHESTRERRHVTSTAKREVYASYGVTHHAAGEYEVDHLIPLALGGSNDVANLWPEAASPVPGYHQKDRVEDWLRAEVCAGRMALAEAQRQIATDWVAVLARVDGGSSAGDGDGE